MSRLAALTLEFPLADFTQAKACELGPFFQGALMQAVDSEYAEQLHASSFNPYSQYAWYDKGPQHLFWRISALNEQAQRKILTPLSILESIELERPGIELNCVKTTLETIDVKQLTRGIYDTTEGKFRVRFITPCAFKVKGNYVSIPTPRLIFQNLLMHYNSIYAGSNEIDEGTIDFIDEHVKITSFNIRSSYFSHIASGGRKIPGCIGTLTFFVGDYQPVRGLIKMLLRFGEYAGVGIKTAMGMGGFRIIDSDALQKRD